MKKYVKKYKVIKSKSGFGLVSAILAAVILAVITVGFTKWYISLNTNTYLTMERMEEMSIAYDRWMFILSEGFDDMLERIDELPSGNRIETLTVGDKYNVTITYGKEGKFEKGNCTTEAPDEDDQACVPVVISVKDKDYDIGVLSQPYTLSTTRIANQDSAGVPVGTVMAWPLSSAPKGVNKDRWLECNGQSVNSSKYPRLAKLMSNVPNYQGMFLRGLGSQSYSQNNGARQDSDTTYSSGGLGATQGDAIRHWLAMTHSSPSDHFVGESWKWGYNGSAYENDNITYVKYNVGYDGNASVAMPYADNGTDAGIGDDRYFARNISAQELRDGWGEALKKITYIPHVSYGSFEGGSYVSDISFEEKYEYPTLYVNTSDVAEVFDSALSNPIANEIRPVNKAVRYMIKAK